ncbi:hypothetical protein C2E23DRAFT_860766 [Lenzites betulinus]|nr:hypothetical protein C2E23DRAFT_860766 [Lenzites betulinus]
MYHSGGPPRPLSTPPTTRRREDPLREDHELYAQPAYEYLLHSPPSWKRSPPRGRSLSRERVRVLDWTAGGHEGGDRHKRRQLSPKYGNSRGRGSSGRHYDNRRREEPNRDSLGYNRGWAACLDKHQPALDRATADHDEVIRLRDEIRLAHQDLADAQLALEREQRRARDAERTALLRLQASESRPRASAFNDRDIVMVDATVPFGRSSYDSEHAPTLPKSTQGAGHNNPQPSSSTLSSTSAYNNARGLGPTTTNGSPIASSQKGKETETDITRAQQANVKKLTLSTWAKQQRLKASHVTDKFMQPPRFKPIPQEFDELESIAQKTTATHGVIAVYQLIQWKHKASDKRSHGFPLTASDKWALTWSVPPWFIEQHDAIRASTEYHVMTPPAWDMPLIHWFRHYDANRKSMRKGLRRTTDGHPELRSLEGLFLATVLAVDPRDGHGTTDGHTVDLIAGLFVSPEAYQATLDRLQLEPALELHVTPFNGHRPAVADDLCKHASNCRLTAWDVRQALSEWAVNYLASNGKPAKALATTAAHPAHTPRGGTPRADVDAPSNEDTAEAPAYPLVNAPILPVDPFTVPLPDGDDMDLDENSHDDEHGECSSSVSA